MPLPFWAIYQIGKKIIQQPFGPGWWNATKGKEPEVITPGGPASIIQDRPKSPTEKKDDTKLILGIVAGVIVFLVVVMIVSGSR